MQAARRSTEALWKMVSGQEALAAEVPDKCFSQPLNPQQPDSQWETDNSQDSANHSRRVLYKRGRHPDHDCISQFNLQIAQQQKQQRCHFSMREYAGLPT